MRTYRPCAMPDCPTPAASRGLCDKHRQQIVRGKACPPREPSGPGVWSRAAACVGIDSEIFFPVRETADDEATAFALEICGECPVRAECLEWALESMPDGICGGHTAEQRRVMRRARHAAAVAGVA